MALVLIKITQFRPELHLTVFVPRTVSISTLLKIKLLYDATE